MMTDSFYQIRKFSIRYKTHLRLDGHVVIVSSTLAEILVGLGGLVLQAEHRAGPLQHPSQLVLCELLLPDVLGWGTVTRSAKFYQVKIRF